jgi:hypothetical protein
VSFTDLLLSTCAFFKLNRLLRLLAISVEHSWAKIVHSNLICMLTNILYIVSDVQNNVFDTHFIPERIELLGGIDYICLEVGPSPLYL